jgi:hypothetical protein
MRNSFSCCYWVVSIIAVSSAALHSVLVTIQRFLVQSETSDFVCWKTHLDELNSS